MATLIPFAVLMGLMGVISGSVAAFFCKVIRGIRQEDRVRASLRFDPPSSAARAARALTGISSSRWD